MREVKANSSRLIRILLRKIANLKEEPSFSISDVRNERKHFAFIPSYFFPFAADRRKISIAFRCAAHKRQLKPVCKRKSCFEYSLASNDKQCIFIFRLFKRLFY